MKTITEEQRASIARGWAHSGLAQPEYARGYGISARTLRSWIARYASRQAPVEIAMALIKDAIDGLTDILVALKEAAGEDAGHADAHDADRHAGSSVGVGTPSNNDAACRSAATRDQLEGTAEKLQGILDDLDLPDGSEGGIETVEPEPPTSVATPRNPPTAPVPVALRPAPSAHRPPGAIRPNGMYWGL